MSSQLWNIYLVAIMYYRYLLNLMFLLFEYIIWKWYRNVNLPEVGIIVQLVDTILTTI